MSDNESVSDLERQIRELEDRLDMTHSKEVEETAKQVAHLQD